MIWVTVHNGDILVKILTEPESSAQHRNENQPKEGFLPHTEDTGVIEFKLEYTFFDHIW